MDYYNENALRAEIARNRLTVQETADNVGISRRAFFVKLKTGNWKVSEAYALANALHMDAQRFNDVFFYPEGHVISD